MEQTQEKAANDHILVTPTWLLVCRIFQSLISVIILAMAARLMHDAYLDEEGLALAISLITWLIVKYLIFSERYTAFQPFYNIIAVLVLDGLMLILWLATWAAVAARRAAFVYNVSVDGCLNSGSLINSETCFIKRDVILFKSGGAMLAAIAGLGALVWLLFIATFSWTLWAFLQARKEGRFQFGSTGGVTTQTIAMEPKLEAQTLQPQQQPPIQQQVPIQPQPTGQYPQAQYPPQGQYYPQQTPSPYPQEAPGVYPPAQTPSPYPQAQSPYQQQPAYTPPPQAAYPPQDQQAAYAQYPPQQHQQYQQPIQPQPHVYPQTPASPPPPQQQPYQAP